MMIASQATNEMNPTPNTSDNDNDSGGSDGEVYTLLL